MCTFGANENLRVKSVFFYLLGKHLGAFATKTLQIQNENGKKQCLFSILYTITNIDFPKPF